MPTPKELHEKSRILIQYGKALRDEAERARKRSDSLREIANRANISGDASRAYAEAARRRHDEC
jgi:hypothetical protein